MLGKRIDDAKRKQLIYSQKSLNCYVSGGSNTGQKHSQIIVFPLGFREVFSLLPSCLCGFILSNTMELEDLEKILEIPMRFITFLRTPVSWWAIHGKGKDELSMPIYPNCHHVWIESFHTIPTHFFTELLLVETSPLNEDFYPEKTTYNMKSCDIQ